MGRKEKLGRNALALQDGLKTLDLFGRTGDDAERWTVGRCKGQRSGEPRLDRRRWGAHAEHGAGRERLHEAPALAHELHRLLQSEHSGQARRDELADAVPHEGDWLHAPALPQRGERILNREERRLSEDRLAERRLGRLNVRRRRIKDLTQIASELGAENLGASIDRALEDRLHVINRLAHADVLRPLAGKTKATGASRRSRVRLFPFCASSATLARMRATSDTLLAATTRR